MGDIFVTHGIPVIDPDGGGDKHALVETVDFAIAHLKSTSIFIPEHGPVGSEKELIVFGELLHTILDSVETKSKTQQVSMSNNLNHPGTLQCTRFLCARSDLSGTLPTSQTVRSESQ